MWNVAGAIITILALAASIVFYFKSARQLRIAINVFGGFLEGSIKGNDVKFRRNKTGDITGLSVVVHPGSIGSAETFGEAVLHILKKAE